MKKFALLLAVLVLAGSLWNLRIAGMKEAPIDYKSEMVQLISNLRAYSKSKKQDFLLLGNGGVNIYYAADAAPAVPACSGWRIWKPAVLCKSSRRSRRFLLRKRYFPHPWPFFPDRRSSG